MGAACVGALATLPQVVAYGLIAVSPLGTEWAVFGIMASVGSAILFGVISGAVTSNRFLVSGPSALTALVLATAVQSALERGYEARAALALAFAGVVVAGLLQLIAGVSRVGKMVSYIPLPVLAGFVSGSAILVLISSLPMILGLPDWSLWKILTGATDTVSMWAATVGGLTIFCIFAFEGRVRFIPAAVLGLAVGTLVYHGAPHFFDLPKGPEVGYIDVLTLGKMPLLLEGDLNWTLLWREADIPFFSGLSIGFLAAFSTALTTSALDATTGSESDSDRDLCTHGLLNALMGIMGFLPASGALTRSKSIIGAGAETRVANVGSSVIFLLMLTLLAPVVATLPLWATAGMLAATAVQAIDRTTLVKIRGIVMRSVPYPRVLAGDVAVTLCVVFTALVSSLIAAVGVGIALAALLFVLGMGRDPVRRVYQGGKIHSKVLRSGQQMALLETQAHKIAVIEVQGALFFGACARLQSQAKRLIAQGAEYLILDFRHLTSIDSTGAALLRNLALNCAEAGGRMLLSCIEPERRIDPTKRRRHVDADVKPQRVSLRWVWLNLDASGVIPMIGTEWICDDTDTALAKCEEILLLRAGRSGKPGARGIIASSNTFAGLTRTQIIGLKRYTLRHRFDAGEVVFAQGEPGGRAFFLVNGRMDVLIDIPGSVRKRRVSALTEGTLFAEMGLLDGEGRSATVRSVNRSVCFSIDAENFGTLQNESPDVALILLRNLSCQFANRLRLANNMISELEQ